MYIVIKHSVNCVETYMAPSDIVQNNSKSPYETSDNI